MHVPTQYSLLTFLPPTASLLLREFRQDKVPRQLKRSRRIQRWRWRWRQARRDRHSAIQTRRQTQRQIRQQIQRQPLRDRHYAIDTPRQILRDRYRAIDTTRQTPRNRHYAIDTRHCAIDTARLGKLDPSLFRTFTMIPYIYSGNIVIYKYIYYILNLDLLLLYLLLLLVLALFYYSYIYLQKIRYRRAINREEYDINNYNVLIYDRDLIAIKTL